MIDVKLFDDGQMEGYTYRDSFMDLLRSDIDGFVTPSGHAFSVCVGATVFGGDDTVTLKIELQDDYDIIDGIVEGLRGTLSEEDPVYALDSVTLDLIKHVVYYSVSLLRQLKIQDVIGSAEAISLMVVVSKTKTELAVESTEFTHLYRIEKPV